MSLSLIALTDAAQTEVGLEEAARTDLVAAAGTGLLELAGVLFDARGTKLVHALLHLHWLAEHVVAYRTQQRLLQLTKQLWSNVIIGGVVLIAVGVVEETGLAGHLVAG